MTTLTRRRDPNRPDCRHIYFGDLCVGYISKRAGVPKNQKQWGWNCGFFPGGPRSKGGDGPSFDACKNSFQLAWDDMQSTLTETSFEA